MTAAAEAAHRETQVANVPFPGLDPFDHAHAPYFFGRDRDRKVVVSNLKAARLTVLYGQSGVGKSSVLLAGVQRELRRRTLDYAAARLGPGAPAKQAPFAVAVFRSWVDDPLPRLMEQVRLAAVEALGGEQLEPWRSGSVTGTLQEWTARCRYVFLILDQFEEYFLYHPPSNEAGSFDVELARIVDEPSLRVHVLLSLREDALALLDRFKATIPKLYDNYLRVDHLDLKAAREAIERPIATYNELYGTEAEIEPALVDALLVAPELRASRAVAVDGASRAAAAADQTAPRIETSYLQLILRRLWLTETENGSHVLRKATLDSLGGLQRITRRHLEEAMAALPNDEQRELAVDVFHHLVTPSKTKMAHSAADLAAYVGRPVDDVGALLDQLCVGNRILRRLIPPPHPDAPSAEPEPRYEIFHDVLADAVLAWREEQLANRRTRAEREAAERELQEQLELEARSREAAQAAADRESRRATAEAREREEAEKAARKERRRALMSLALATVAVAGLVAAALFGLSASRAKDTARSEQLAAAAQADAALDPVLGVKEALQALHVRRTAEAEVALRESLPAARVRAVLPNRGFVGHVVFAGSRDRYAVVASTIGDVRLWDWQHRREVARLHTDGSTTVDAAAGGTKLLTLDGSAHAEIWDVGRCVAARRCSPLIVLPRAAYAAAISADGKRVALLGGTEGPQLFVYDCRRRCRLTPLSVRISEARTPDVVALSDDGTWIALGSSVASNEVDVWHLSDTPPRGIRLFGSWSATVSLSFAPHGPILVGSGDNLAEVWDVRRCAGRRPCAALGSARHADSVNSAAVAPDGHELVTASTDGTADVWEVDGAVSATPLLNLHGHAGAVADAAFNRDGRLLITGSSDQTARIWDVTTGRVLRDSGSPLNDAEFSPDGHAAVTAGVDGAARLFDARSGAELAVLPARFAASRDLAYGAGDLAPQSAAFSPDGSQVVTALRYGAPVVWSLRSCGGQIATGRSTHTLPVTCRPLRELGSSAHYHRLGNAVFKPDAPVVAAATMHGVSFFQASSGRFLLERDPGRRTTRVAFSRSGRYLALAAPDGTTRVYDTGRCGARRCRARKVAQLPSVRGAVYGVAFSPDETLLTTGGADRIVRVRDWHRGKGLLLGAHTSNIRSVSFDRSGRYLVSAGTDGTTVVWQVNHERGKLGGKLLERLQMHAGRVQSAVFAPGSSTTLLTAGDDGTAKIYSCDLCRPLKAVEGIAQRLLRGLNRPATWLSGDGP